jgi:hypothetical protein
MPKFEVHCQECVRVMGEPFEEVHKWLDELFSVCGADHRDIRHNVKGVEKIREMFGDKAAQAATIHIEQDEGCVPIIDDAFKLRLAMKPQIDMAFRKEYDQ